MRPFKFIHLFIIPAAIFFLTGCSAVKEATQDLDARAKQLTPPAGKSIVYVVRPSSLGSAVGFEVFIDSKYIGTTGGSRFIYAIVSPGKHIIKSSAENDSYLSLNAAADSMYYVRQNISMGFLKARNELELLNAIEGHLGVTECSLSSECVEIMGQK